MKLIQLILISGFMMAGTVHASANDGSFHPDEKQSSAAATPILPHSAQTIRTSKTVVALNAASAPRATRSLRIISEPIPGQTRVIKSTNNRGVVLVPNSISGKMRFISPLKSTAGKASTPNLFPK